MHEGGICAIFQCWIDLHLKTTWTSESSSLSPISVTEKQWWVVLPVFKMALFTLVLPLLTWLSVTYVHEVALVVGWEASVDWWVDGVELRIRILLSAFPRNATPCYCRCAVCQSFVVSNSSAHCGVELCWLGCLGQNLLCIYMACPQCAGRSRICLCSFCQVFRWSCKGWPLLDRSLWQSCP